MSRKPIINTTQLYVRIVILVLALGGSLYSIREVKNNKTLDAFFGRRSEQGMQITRGALVLCPTRVARIEVVDKRTNKQISYYQKGSKWIVESDQVFELDPLFMEKWLGEFCEIQVDKFSEATEPAEALQEITFKFIDGTTDTLKVYEHFYRTTFGLVESEELKTAVTRLNP